jgi:DNA polymerase (family 10)
MDKDQVAAILNEIAVLLELKGENPFKSRAYQNAARIVESFSEPLTTIIANGQLQEMKGIGEALQKKITELATTGSLLYYQELKASIPPGLIEMLQLSGIGPKKIKALHEKLGIETIEQLETACKEGKVAELPGFGAKTQGNICAAIERRRAYATRHLLSAALAMAEPLLENLRQHPDVIRCSSAGSLRRHKEVVADVDFVVSSKNAAAVIDFFASQPSILTVEAKGDTKASVLVKGGIQVDLRVVTDQEYPFALAYFTGSKEHNIVMRQRAIQRGLRLNEYGLFRSDVETKDPTLLQPCRTEDEIFQELGLAYIPPELREDAGEFAAAEKGDIPKLIEWTDLKGSLHNHSNWSDGHQTLEQIAHDIAELGCAYWAITDHSKSSVQANGLDSARLRSQLPAIAAVNQANAGEGGFQLLSGIEVDILSNGSLDLEDELLGQLDVVVASIHQSFSQSESEMTARLIKAAENPYVHILGHPTGRRLLEREPYQVNLHAVIDACAETGTWIELNASPYRCDMDWRLWAYAKKKGVKCVINCDAYRLQHAGYLRLGAGMARKGWLTSRDVMNTLSLRDLRKALGQKRAKHRLAHS